MVRVVKLVVELTIDEFLHDFDESVDPVYVVSLYFVGGVLLLSRIGVKGLLRVRFWQINLASASVQ